MDLAHRILLSIECEAYDATLHAFCIVPMLLLHGLVSFVSTQASRFPRPSPSAGPPQRLVRAATKFGVNAEYGKERPHTSGP